MILELSSCTALDPKVSGIRSQTCAQALLQLALGLAEGAYRAAKEMSHGYRKAIQTVLHEQTIVD